MFRLLLSSPILWSIAIALPSAPARALTHLVRPDGSGDFTTIGAALSVAVPEDTVRVGPGIYPEHDLVLRSGVHLVSETDDPAFTTIDAEQLGRCLQVVRDSPSVLSQIRGFTFRNGLADFGGAIYDVGKTVVSQCVFLDNVATDGDGGATYRVMRISHCRFERNLAERQRGGAVYADGSGWVSYCEFLSSRAMQGGAAYVRDVSFVHCSFVGNRAMTAGGALDHHASDSFGIYLTECLFARNRAIGGGATHGTGGVHVSRCTFVANEALSWSAISCSGQVVVDRCIVALGVGPGPPVWQPQVVQCSDFFGNAGGDDFLNDEGDDNIHMALFFCDPLHDDYRLHENSPAVSHCGGIGFDPAPACGTVGVEAETWARIKSGYRD